MDHRPHRENSAATVVFHAEEIPASIDNAVVEADRFVAEVNSKLRKKPQPFREHPYWTGAIAAFNEASGAALSSDEWRRALGLPDPNSTMPGSPAGLPRTCASPSSASLRVCGHGIRDFRTML